MNAPITILGIAGSLRKDSYNRAALRAAQKLLPEGARLEIFELDGIPLFNQDAEKEPPATVTEMKAKIRAANAIFFATPEYNYSIPGVLKNAIDWASRPYGDSAWQGKPVAILGASVGAFGTVRAQHHLRQILVSLNMHAVNQPEGLIGNAAERFGANGELMDENAKKLIKRLLQNLTDWTHRLENGAA